MEILVHEGTYYLCYQSVGGLYNKRVKNQIGLSWSKSPDGPWTKSPNPILSPSDNGIWKGDDLQDRFSVIQKGDFDSHKVHDPCILYYKGKFYLPSVESEAMYDNTINARKKGRWIIVK